MTNAVLDILIYLHKRFTDPEKPLTAEDIAHITGRIEQVLKEGGILPLDWTTDDEPKHKFPRNLLP